MEHILSVVLEIKEEWYKPPSTYFGIKRIEFEHQSYARSAVMELYFYLISHINEDPIKAVEDFRHMADCFACEAKNDKINFMFSIYCDVASDVLDIFLGMQ